MGVVRVNGTLNILALLDVFLFFSKISKSGDRLNYVMLV